MPKLCRYFLPRGKKYRSYKRFFKAFHFYFESMEMLSLIVFAARRIDWMFPSSRTFL